MSSRKNLKKAVKAICGELFADCIALSSIEDAENVENLQNIMAQIALMHNDYVARINNPEPGLKPRKYFAKLCIDFTQQANTLSQDILKS